MMRSFLLGSATALLIAGGAFAQGTGQELVYIQIEAQPSLTQAEAALRGYATRLDNVNGFSLGSGWYGIALGPYAPDSAGALLRELRLTGIIPRDSYLASSSEYRDQFWPVGAGLSTAQPVPQAPDTGLSPATGTPEVVTRPEIAEETPRQARASEALLSRGERELLQVALQWSGHYNAAIDGAFGAGTRNAMAEWQAANGYQVTGVLTSAQRADLIGAYNAVLEGLDMARVSDSRAGIEIEMPTGVVSFDRYEAPFALYEPSGDLQARVLLISQPGDRKTLAGLYEIMQTLEIVPPTGPRERGRDSFSITGQNARIVSHTEVALREGHIKGWTLIWPAGDEERRERVSAMMKASFATTAAVLDPASVTDEGQAVDLVSGLKIRQPIATVSGFFVDAGGAVVTSAEAVASCGRITLDDIYDASVAATDAELGVAVLRPEQALAPRGVANLRSGTPRLKTEIAVAGYPFGGVLSAPTLTYGSLEDSRGLGGEETLARVALAAQPGDAGGPVLDAGGAVLGMLLPEAQGARQLPAGVALAADADALKAFLDASGVRSSGTAGQDMLAPEDLAAAATKMTVKVSCWD
ncbi:MAG: peptidoglycan-binding protein [Yangia sp.]|nr:peptidoglycan-binding protein [Salipiger sp.]